MFTRSLYFKFDSFSFFSFLIHGQMKFEPACGKQTKNPDSYRDKETRFHAQGHSPSAGFRASARSPKSLLPILRSKWKNNVKFGEGIELGVKNFELRIKILEELIPGSDSGKVEEA